MSASHPNLRLLVTTLALLLFMLPQGLFAQEAPPSVEETTISERVAQGIEGTVGVFTDRVVTIVFYEVPIPGTDVKAPWVLGWLALAALIMTLYFKFVNLRSFGLALRTVRGKYDEADDPGEITHFQALTAALSATVGLGNIAGVAVAVAIGGPGATVWMVIVGFLGMSAKFAECTLGVHYRSIDENGTVYGGPMHYLKKGFAEKGMGTIGAVLAGFFAVMCIGGSFGGGNMYQVNQAGALIADTFGIHGKVEQQTMKLVFGVIVAVLVGLVIIGGIKGIARVTSKLVPLMCGIYVLGALLVIIANIGHVPAAFGHIFSEAFRPIAVGGGILGVMIQGIKRASFSNEAGIGSAPIAHSAVKTKKPASEGVVALLEPFVDTVVICTMTALVLVITDSYKIRAQVGDAPIEFSAAAGGPAVGSFPPGAKLATTFTTDSEIGSQLWTEVSEFDGDAKGWIWKEKDEKDSWQWQQGIKELKGTPVTAVAFDTVITHFSYVMSIAVVLFAFSTMISWSYYGQQAWAYLFGRSKAMEVTYKLIFCFFIVAGAVLPLSKVLDFSDAMIFAMAVPNVLGLYVLSSVVKKDWIDFTEFAAKRDSDNS
ncbi:MAG: alanine:cation symporter family protein [Verrucomicrobiae bacterium]|nr:alanine:cation symporter family protein [Verrucomicrobiae bacterium]